MRISRRLRFSLFMCAGAVMVLAQALPAHACSCFPEDPRDAYERADGAFIGTYVGRHALSEDTEFGEYAYTFEVDEEFKGDLGETVDVISASNGAMCGLEVGEGDRIGLMLELAEDGWRSNLCRQTNEEELRRVAEPLPEPNGTPPAGMLIGGSFGQVRVMSLDAEGRILAYNNGEDGNYDVIHISVCPGGRRMIELFRAQFGLSYAVRDVETLALVREGAVLNGSYGSFPQVFCRDPEANKVFALVSNYEGPARVVRLGSPNRTMFKGKIKWGAFGGDRVYLRRGKRELIALDLDNKKQVVTTSVRGSAPLSVGPDGLKVAWLVPRSGTITLYLMDASSRRPALRQASLEDSFAGPLAWMDAGRFILTSCGQSGASVKTYDINLQELGSAPASCSFASAVLGETLWSIDYEARLLKQVLPSGTEEIVLELPSPTAFTIVTIPPP